MIRHFFLQGYLPFNGTLSHSSLSHQTPDCIIQQNELIEWISEPWKNVSSKVSKSRSMCAHGTVPSMDIGKSFLRKNALERVLFCTDLVSVGLIYSSYHMLTHPSHPPCDFSILGSLILEGLQLFALHSFGRFWLYWTKRYELMKNLLRKTVLLTHVFAVFLNFHVENVIDPSQGFTRHSRKWLNITP